MRILLCLVVMATLVACHSSDSVEITNRDNTDVESRVGNNENRPITCGDGICGLDEDTINCVADCGTWCGDGVCNGLESISLCPTDCDDSGTGTGNGDDNDPPAEDCSGCLEGAPNCESSCQDKGFGGGFCGAPGSKNPAVCCVCEDNQQPPPASGPVCGDGACEGSEDSDNCADDCEPECGPSPHYELVNGECLPSCGVLINAKGWSDGTCCKKGCAGGNQPPNSTWDCTYCCPGKGSCVNSKPSPPPEPPLTTDCALGGEYDNAIQASVLATAKYVKKKHPEFFDIEDWDDLAKRKQAYKMMTVVINHLRAKCVNASRCVANPGHPQSDPFYFCSDALVIGPPGKGTTVDIYYSWSYPGKPQTSVTQAGGQTGVVTDDLVALP